jgi:hypothetical protein
MLGASLPEVGCTTGPETSRLLKNLDDGQCPKKWKLFLLVTQYRL